MTPTLSVIIPAHSPAHSPAGDSTSPAGEQLRRCLAAVQAMSPAPHEIWVVSDACAESAETARSMGVQTLVLPVRSGPARARNVGAAAASGEILLFLDADVVARPQLACQVSEFFAANAEIAAAFGSYDDDPSERNFFSQFKNLFHHYVHHSGKQEALTFWAGCGAIRKAAFSRMGGFDESRKRPSIEDIELGYRLTESGFRVQLRPEWQVQHLKRWTLASLIRVDVLDRAVPWTLLLLGRRARIVPDLNLSVSSRLNVVGVYCLAGALLLAPAYAPARLAIALLAAALVAGNFHLYSFFWRKRGAFFSARSVAAHWLYCIYSGLGFCLGALAHGQNRARKALGA